MCSLLHVVCVHLCCVTDSIHKLLEIHYPNLLQWNSDEQILPIISDIFPFSHLLEAPKLYSWYTQGVSFCLLIFCSFFLYYFFPSFSTFIFHGMLVGFKTLPGGTLRIADFSLLLHVSTNQSVCQLSFPINSFIKFILWCRNVCLLHIAITVSVKVE